ncbi:hypothetical protein LCGC14_2566970 [marine sediment metagenome]|uniref:Uncharacterized protein n=1 Tax=marine sediment metagenome TaxID=412755 RepID=A0A0F9CUF3_9ZZZZ
MVSVDKMKPSAPIIMRYGNLLEILSVSEDLPVIFVVVFPNKVNIKIYKL